jgi:hypothetical protein
VYRKDPHNNKISMNFNLEKILKEALCGALPAALKGEFTISGHYESCGTIELQTDGTSCGVYCIAFVKCKLRNTTTETVESEDIDLLRERIFKQIQAYDPSVPLSNYCQKEGDGKAEKAEGGPTDIEQLVHEFKYYEAACLENMDEGTPNMEKSPRTPTNSVFGNTVSGSGSNTSASALHSNLSNERTAPKNWKKEMLWKHENLQEDASTTKETTAPKQWKKRMVWEHEQDSSTTNATSSPDSAQSSEANARRLPESSQSSPIDPSASPAEATSSPAFATTSPNAAVEDVVSV